MHEARLNRVMSNLHAMGLQQTLVCDPLSVWYLTGYHTEPMERFFALYLAQDGNRIRSTLFVNKLFPSAEGAADHLVTFTDTDDPIALVASTCDSSLPLGIDKTLSARWLIPLLETESCSGVRLASTAVDDARSVKDADERRFMRTASQLNDASMEWLVRQIAEGVSELQIAERLPKAYRELGASGNSFAPIISFGSHIADPHHESDKTTLRRGEMVLFDVGCKYERYCADMTRTFFTTTPTTRQLEVYNTVRRANETAEAMVRPGVLFSEIDHAARSVIEEAGYGPHFKHRLGHQIGLSVHEPGDVSAAHDEPVRPGQCFSIEPGIYLPGEFGVRIEDLVLVTPDGCEVLNHYTHEPLVIEV